MSGNVVKEVAEGIYADHTRFDMRKVAVDSLAVTLPIPKAGEMQALKHVLNELGIDLDKKNVQSSWVSASVTDDRLTVSDLKIAEGLVPRVTGMGAKDAVYLLESAGLQVNLSGVGRVISQSVPPGQKAVRGQSVTITLK
jgi:cell division protein FtsI (penicillin-binding protein 3)